MQDLILWLLVAVQLCLSPAHAGDPTVTISNGVIIGTRNAMQSQDRFLAIPYAQAPTGTLRLRPPQPISTNYGTITATESPSACPQFAITAWSGVTVASNSRQSSSATTPNILQVFQVLAPAPTATVNPEDCLRLNVQRPANANPSSKLPVLVFTWGGGLENGGVTPQYDAASWLSKAMSMNAPFVYVSSNWRLGASGFLPGKQAASDNATNLGLRDQRAVLEWIADNIAAFGGDPDKVTIMGNSGGALCVMDQTIINRGDNTYKGRPLFRGVILSSGSTQPALDNTDPKAQAIFDGFADAAGCDHNSPDVMDCLRGIDIDTFNDAQNTRRFDNDALNVTWLPRPDSTSNFFPTSPEQAVFNGEYVKVPMIVGNQQDEGTFWGVLLSNFDGNNDQQITGFLSSIFGASPDTWQTFVSTYPKDITAGCPYNTGILSEIYPGYKRISSIFTDFLMIMARRMYLDTLAPRLKIWSYISTYDGPVLQPLGSCHSTDMQLIWSGAGSPFAADQLFTRFTSFIAKGDPNALLPLMGYDQWPQYTTNDRTLISFNIMGTSYLKDTFRAASYQALKAFYPQCKI